MRTIVTMPGDGIGKVVLPEAIRVLEKAGFQANYVHGDIGWDCWCNEGNALPERTIKLLEEFKEFEGKFFCFLFDFFFCFLSKFSCFFLIFLTEVLWKEFFCEFCCAIISRFHPFFWRLVIFKTKIFVKFVLFLWTILWFLQSLH